MGVQCELIIADPSEAPSVVASDGPAQEWDGFTFNGLHSVQLCTLLSLLDSGDPLQQFDRYLDAIPVVADEDDGARVVSAVHPPEVGRLATVAQMEDDEFNRLASTWGKTNEFDGWTADEVTELLRLIGDLAETAALGNKSLLLWISL